MSDSSVDADSIVLFVLFLFWGWAGLLISTGAVAYGIIVILLMVGGYGIYTYNKIIKRENKVDTAYGHIQTYLKKRHDLIPNLVSSVKEYMKHESNTLQEIVELRKAAASDDLPQDEKERVESNLTQALDLLIVQVEDYPDLKVNKNFEQLMGSLNDIEEDLSASRRYYNSTVKRYNDSIQIFPGVVIASFFKFKPHNMFKAEIHEHRSPSVKSKFEEAEEK